MIKDYVVKKIKKSGLQITLRLNTGFAVGVIHTIVFNAHRDLASSNRARRDLERCDLGCAI